MKTNALYESQLTSLPLIGRGKVRDLYQADDEHMLIVTTDRLSAFDVVFAEPVPGKGKILTAISRFWFNKLQHIVPNHLAEKPLTQYLKPSEIEQLDGRGMLVKKLQTLPIEAVVRAYLIGSGWQDYQNTGAVCGISLPAGLQQAEQLASPIFTPATKAAIGDHDENIDFNTVIDLIGRERAEEVRSISLRLYTEAAEHARNCGIIIADTKFEFGLDSGGALVLIDEALTPDSSRLWPVEQYKTGTSPPSYDKQIVRDYLETLTWDKTPPAPKLPAAIIDKTKARYQDALQQLTENA